MFVRLWTKLRNLIFPFAKTAEKRSLSDPALKKSNSAVLPAGRLGGTIIWIRLTGKQSMNTPAPAAENPSPLTVMPNANTAPTPATSKAATEGGIGDDTSTV